MDKGINMHKELAMGLAGGKREASGKMPQNMQVKKPAKMKKGGAVKGCGCKGGK